MSSLYLLQKVQLNMEWENIVFQDLHEFMLYIRVCPYRCLIHNFNAREIILE